ncbi:hypothetical protein AQUCO_03800091v1 [Aquilegia coerulea]|uniref:SnoaL-like domain-containing protein n=1 Tax=Aquilegia coerulea TaxID=218851 RepID=A0A2G5CSJ8_AQUCA|nr:hypothetical protein AQUCO_03800091v1 [Aquilegia coerulea]
MATICLPSPIHRRGIQIVNTKCFPCQTTRKIYSSFNWKKKNVVHKPYNKQRLIMSSVSRVDQPQPSRFTTTDVVVQFYDCINDKNLKMINELISDDCCFEDYSFIQPFHGKKEVAHFYEDLTECMGKNVKFIIQSVCQGDNLSVAISWHLEWKGKHIPFTRGCSFYECSKQGDKLLIEHARAIIESPIKPGSLVLTVLKVVSYLFDEFPGVTEKFLQKPQVILQFLQKIYSIFLEPFIHPVLECYINLGKFIARILGYMFNILIHMLRILLK